MTSNLTSAGAEFGIPHKFLHADIYTASNNLSWHARSGKAFKNCDSKIESYIASKDKVFLRA